MSNSAFIFNVSNDGLLPVRLLGVVNSSEAIDNSVGWTAVWTYSDQRGGVPEPSAAVPFKELDLLPGQRVLLYLVGRAGRCAAGSTYDPANEYGYAFTDNIPVAFSVFGLNSVARVQIPITVMEPERPIWPLG